MSKKKWINDLSDSIENKDWDTCSDLCFKILFYTPANIQIDLCVCMMREYLDIFEKKHPDIKWPRETIDNVIKNSAKAKVDIPERTSDLENHDDASFLYCFNALEQAFEFLNNNEALTSCCASILLKIITAYIYNDWIAKSDEMTYSEFIETNADKIDEEKWRQILNWFNDKMMWKYNTVPIKNIHHSIERWNANEKLMILPYDFKG